MADSERAPLLSADDSHDHHDHHNNHDTHDTHDSHENENDNDDFESTPLVRSSSGTPRYDGDDDHPGDGASIASRRTGGSTKSSKRRKTRWPSIIAMIILAFTGLAVLVLAFIVPPALQEYAKAAVVLEPTNLSLESITAHGIRARVQLNFRVEAQRVENEHVRWIGKTVSWIVREMGTGKTKINFHLPDYKNALLGSAVVPPTSASIVDGENTPVDFVAELAAGEAEGIRRIANQWLEGKLKNVQIRGEADVQFNAGIIPLGTHFIENSLTFEGGKLPHMPKYNITRVNFKERPVPGARKGMGAEITVKAFNKYPISLDIPELGFEVLVPGCHPGGHPIVLANATTSQVAVRARSDVFVDANGLIKELPASLTQICPNSKSSPLDLLFKKYLHGKKATVLVRGRKGPDTPEWIGDILSSITVPVPFPGRSFDNLIRSFSLTDVHFKMPDPGAEPDDPSSNPRVSGTILVVAGLPSEMNFALNVNNVRAHSDVFYKGKKLGELNLKKWQYANSTQTPAAHGKEAKLEIRSRIRDAPLEVTDPDVMTDVIQALLFGGKEVMLTVKALVDVKVQTILGKLAVKAIPAEGKIPVKPFGEDLLGFAAPRVGKVEIVETTPSSLSIRTLVNITNPTQYSAHIPFVSFYVENNGTLLGEAFAEDLDVQPGNNTNLALSALWNPSLGGDGGPQHARDLLSEYISGYNTTVTIRTHRSSIPSLPRLGEALSRLNLTLPTPRLRLPDRGDRDDQNNSAPQFIRDATFHIFSSTATFTLVSPLSHNTIFIDSINATALYNHTEPIGRIEYNLPFAAPPGTSVTPKMPVDWSMDSVGYGKLREALGGRMKLDARAVVGVRLGRWTETVWMRTILPGRPESRLQALATGCWEGKRITAYITGNALAILGGRIYDDDPAPLCAVALDEASGKIAVCTRRVVRVLELYQTSANLAEPECSWRKRLASPVRRASLSYDSAYIASVGAHDRLVKVWRRLSYGTGEVRFDFLYLRHPRPVTGIQWQCAVYVLRGPGVEGHAGSGTGGDDLRWAFIIHGGDLAAAAETAVQEGGGRPKGDTAALDHLITVANQSPEICIVLDGRGRMSAWALEIVGSKTGRRRSNIFNVAQVTSQELDLLRNYSSQAVGSRLRPPHVEAYSYCQSGEHMQILLHFFDGRIEVYRSNLAALFDPSPKPKQPKQKQSQSRVTQRALWTGHSEPIRKIVRNFSGRAIVSRTANGQGVIWKHEPGARGRTGLTQQVVIPEQGHIHRMCLLRNGRFVVFLQHETISLWDCRQSTPSRLAEQRYDVPGKPLCLLVLPRRQVEDYTTAHIATITSEKKGVVWEVKFPFYSSRPRSAANGVSQEPQQQQEHQQPSIRESAQFTLEDAGDLAYVLPVDPAGAAPHISGFLDVFARDVAVSYTHSGRVEFWTARVRTSNGVEWLSTCATHTGIANPSLVSGSTRKKAALVNAARSGLTIWDVRGARLEYTQDFGHAHGGHHTISDLDWTSTPDTQSILAVGFPHRVLLLSQMRFDYLNGGPAWAAIREISIRDATPHPIGDSVWLGDGHLVIGAGNQLFVQDRQFDAGSALVTSLRLPQRPRRGLGQGKGRGQRGGEEKGWDLFDAVQRLNGPLPVFHPQFLSQCILAGKIVLVHAVLMALYKTLKFWAEGDELDDYLGLKIEDFYEIDHTTKTSAHKDPGQYLSRRMSYDDEGGTPFSEDIAAAINQQLTRIDIAQLSGHEQIQLVNIIECAGLVEAQRRSLDENGARFMLFFRQHALRKGRTSAIQLGWREINWAYHSESQDVLADFVARQNHGRMLWENARESGVFMWLADNAAVAWTLTARQKAQFETIARNEYTKSDLKNPIDCSLYYLALRKKTVLQGLWRMAAWNREQGATQRLLANNFDDPKWRTAALKNAYALMSKRRFEYAAAFFLLADHLADAVNVCLNQLQDLQLAIAVARVYEGDSGPVLRRLLEEEVLSIAAREGNRWLASWAFWMLHRRDMAVRALITPVYTLLETPGSPPDPPDPRARLFLTDDPALVILYAQLRQKTLQTLRGASKVTPKVEWEFVLHSARLYDRMGCDLLGLDLVRNWEFLQPVTAGATGLGGEVNPLRLLRRRESLVVADLPVLSHIREEKQEKQQSQQQSQQQQNVPAEMKSGGLMPKQQAPPTAFEEPDANSLLDSFGF
ncbi:RAVE protein 1 C terminal-domain-containing protein [Dichotomopilus funicola]|uniref:RAVE protein 1 C terminal-domain-containing protein n=1 Tax=Dichotomopilus funicola TaxID=1934379 RepID=A0AAN6UYK2_9PEZI|nr:RAVE protein 1 C terminal-domain-containing protein [Dichotomopilus funicola]